MLALVTCRFTAIKSSSSTESTMENYSESRNMHRRTAAMLDLILTRSMVCGGVVLASVLMPLYVGGARYYECGDAVVISTSAYLADAIEIESVTAAVLIAVAVSSVAFAARFLVAFHSTREWGWQEAVVEERKQQQWRGGSVNGVNGVNDYNADGGSSVEAVVGGSISDTINDTIIAADHSDNGTSTCRTVLLFMMWVASLLLLLIPSVVYGMATAVPTESRIPGFAVIAEVMHWAAPLIITVINSAIVPRVVDYCCDRSRWQSARLLLVSRLLTTWVVPVAVVMIFNNSCGRMWLPLWEKCSPEKMKELDVFGPSGNMVEVLESVCFETSVGGGRHIYEFNGYINRTVLVSGAQICDPHAPPAAGRQRYAQCGRAVVEAMAPLLIGKMALAALLLPAIHIFGWRVAPAGWSVFVRGFIGRCCRQCSCRCTMQGGSGGEGDSVHSGEEKEGDDGGIILSLLADDSGGGSTAPLCRKGLRLDNMVAQSLTWMDVAIVFGPHIPVLLPLVMLSLFMARWTHEAVGLRRLGLRERRAEFSKPSAQYVLFSVVCQQMLTAAVFIGVGEGGDGSGVFGAGTEGRMALLMVVVEALASAVCVALALAPVRWLEAVGQWWMYAWDSLRFCCCCYVQRGREEEWSDLGSVTELSSRSLRGGFDVHGNGEHGGGAAAAADTGSLEVPLLLQAS
jgi:hypothetical protein